MSSAEDEISALIESGGEHRIQGRNSEGKFKKGKSGNPNGRPKGSGKKETATIEKTGGVVIDFKPREAKTVAESIEQNSVNFMNAAWMSMANGNQRLSEIAFTQMLKDKGKGMNPFAGLGELSEVTPEELILLAENIESGDLDV